MKRYISYSVSVFLALMLFSSCEQESFTPNLAQSNTLTLQFTTGNMESRATIEGENVLNENFISTLDVFLYPNTADNTVAATKYIYVSEANANDSYKVTVTLSSEELDALFGENAESGTCRVYAIANRTTDLPSTTSIDELKKLKETTDYFTDNEDHGTGTQRTDGIKLGRQANFVMDSDATNDNDGYDVVTLTTVDSNKSLTGFVPLYRSASKIGLFVNVKESITDDSGVTWVSNPKDMRMIFHHGVKSGYIGNDIYTYSVNSTDDYFSIETERTLTNSTEINSKTYYTSSAPYYSYPWDWSSQTTDENTPYITLIIPWKRKDAESFELCRYQIPVNSLASNELPAKCLDRNTYYQMLLNVGILGAFEESEAVELTPSYMVVPWGNETMGTIIKENSYLVVEKNYVVINNLDEISVGYVASHDISIEIISMTQKDISTVFPTDISYARSTTKSVNEGTKGTETNSSVNLAPTLLKTCTINNDENNIILTHELVNYGDEGIDLGDRFDLTPYYITVRVSMTVGNLTFTEDIVFVQYPAIYMEPMLNSDHADINSASKNYGYVIVNGNNNAGSSGDFGDTTVSSNATGFTAENVQWVGQVYTVGDNNNREGGNFTPGDDNAGTKNPNMYVLTLSSFQTNDFLIGDPRTLDYTDVFQVYTTGDLKTGDTDNDGYWDNTNNMQFGSTNNVWANATALYGNAPRRLTYYYATDESERTQNVIAPKIRFASSHSIPAPIVKSKEMAKRRCASYQEDGYPAGRWRLPTKAEVEFTMGLNQGGLIPHVFNTTLPYWSAHGYFKSDMSFSTDTSVTGQGSVRCVYDEWYWGSEQITDKATFVWGDYPRDSYPPTN